MDENLRLLINHYEVEQQLLQSLLNECLLEEDYEFAKYYSKNLRILKETLYNLYSLSDYNHAEKTEVLRVISNIEFMSKKATDNSFNVFRDKSLKEFNEKLSILNELPIKEVEEKYDIENAVIRLLEKEINGFKIFILKRFNLYLDFTLVETDIIHIEFTPFNFITNDYSFDDLFHYSEIEALYKNGFKLTEDQNILYSDFDLKNKSTRLLNTFLSYLFFEILHYHSKKAFGLETY